MNNHIENPNTHNRLVVDLTYESKEHYMDNFNNILEELRLSQALVKQQSLL